MKSLKVILVSLVSLFVILPNGIAADKVKSTPLVIGHRGASGHRPEHTKASYEVAIDMGADYIEPDLVMTKDRVLIARHENDISETTDVAVKFPKLKKTKKIDGESITGWFTEDLTLKEIKTLHARERLAGRSQAFNNDYEVITFEEVIKVVKEKSKQKGRRIGIIPELKHPTYFKSIGLDLIPEFVRIMKREKLDRADSLAIVQCFELGILRELKLKISTPLLYLISDPKELTPAGLKEISQVAGHIGPPKAALIKPDGSTSGLMSLAQAAGLKVMPYTFRNEPEFVIEAARSDPQQEYKMFYDLGVDGVFTDFPGDALKALKSWKLK